MSIGPARFSVLWPANGVALALVLAWGPRVLPGLLLGSLPALALRTPELNQAALYELGLAMAARCGSLLQWWLQQRWLSPWGAWLQSRGARLATRFTVSTLVCCTLAPTLGLLALWSAGRIDGADVVPTWVIWWSGDAAGTLVFAPIILTLLHRRVREHVLANQTFPMLAVGLGLTMATTAMLGELGRVGRVERATAESRAFAQGFQGQLALVQSDLARLAALHHQGPLKETDFDRLATQIRTARSALNGFAHLRLVPAQERAALETSLRQNLRSKSADGSLGRSPERPEYWVVTRLNPGSGQESRLGVDEAQDPERRQAIESAVATGETAVTGVLSNINYAERAEEGLLLYQSLPEGRSATQRTTGLVSATVQLRALIDASLASSVGLQFPTLLVSSIAPFSGVLIEGSQIQEIGGTESKAWLAATSPRSRVNLDLGDGLGQWRLHALHTTRAWYQFAPTQWAALALGLTSTALLCLVLLTRARNDHMLRRWNEELHAEVQRRTAELDAVNHQLQAEVNERASANQALSHERARFANIVEGTGAGTWEWNLATGLVTINERMSQMLGRDREDGLVMRGEEWLLSTHPEDLPEARRRVGDHFKGLTPLFTTESRQRLPNGDWVWTRAIGRVASRSADGQALDMNGILLDITERKAADDLLHQARAEAVRASQAKSRFLANMSHEIRTPLSAVIGLSYLFQDTPLDEHQRTLVAKTQLAARSLLALINDVLDLSKIEAGEMKLELAALNLPGLLADVQRLMTVQAETKGISLQLELAPGLPEHVQGDELRLRQILINLVGNAIKFTERGSVTLSARTLPRQPDDDAKLVRVRLTVRDTGIGIATEALSRLFTPFSQADDSSTRRFAGTGLGLSIVRDLAQMMGGHADVTSELGRGSTFGVELPMTVVLGLVPGSAQALSVLVADDDAEHRDALCTMARHLGWQVEAVADGTSLVRRATQRLHEGQPPDALLVDWRMPGLDGLSALFRLQEAFGSQALPAAVLVTGAELTMLREAPHAALAQSVLTKPVLASSLFNAVNSAVIHQQGSYERLLRSTQLRASGAQWLPGLRVLVADDSDINLDVARHLLEREGAIVETAADGHAAIEAVQSGSFDAVLMDVQMPVMDGHEATRRLRLDPRWAQLPIIALTAGALASERQHALEAGMSDFLTKPLDPDHLVRTLRRHVEHARGSPLPAQATAPRADANATGPTGAASGLGTAHAEAGMAQWPAIAGIDGPDAFRRLNGDRGLLLRLLRRLLAEFQDIGPTTGADQATTGAALAAGDLAPSTISDVHAALAGRLHKLRGAAGMVAAGDVHRLAGEAEREALHGRSRAEMERWLAPLASALRELARHAQPWLQAAEAEEQRRLESASASDGLDIAELRQLLLSSDLAVLAKVAQGETSLRARLGADAMVRFKACIDALDFAAAAALIPAPNDDTARAPMRP